MNLNLKYQMPGPGIGPQMTACQADVLTTTLSRLAHNRITIEYQPAELHKRSDMLLYMVTRCIYQVLYTVAK